MMWDKSTIFTNRYNDEISAFYNNLCQNQKLFDKFINYIKNLQNNYGEKQCFFEFLSGMETSYLVFNNEIERLNSHVASAADSLRKFNQTREQNKTNCEWDELSKQIRTLIELLNHFLINMTNTNNSANSNKLNQELYESEHHKVNNFSQTGRNANFLGHARKYYDETSGFGLLNQEANEQNPSNFRNDIPAGTGPIRRKRPRHSTSCCSCGKSKVANKHTQTNESKKHQDKSCGCCSCNSQEEHKLDKDSGSWVTLFEVQTQTGNETNSQEPQYSINDHRLIAENVPSAPLYSVKPSDHQYSVRPSEPQYSVREFPINNQSLRAVPYFPANKPPSSSISPTPYGVSSNSLPGNSQKAHVHNLTPMEDNVKLLLKLLEEIEKSLQVVKQLYEALLAKTGNESTKNVISNSTNQSENDINLRLTITLENDLPESRPSIELSQIPDNRKSITPSILTSGKRLSSFFKRKNENLSVNRNNDIPSEQYSVREFPMNNKSLRSVSYFSANKPPSSLISPTPYGVSSNSLPGNSQKTQLHELTRTANTTMNSEQQIIAGNNSTKSSYVNDENVQGEDNHSYISETSSPIKISENLVKNLDGQKKSSINYDFDRILSDFASFSNGEDNNNSRRSRRINTHRLSYCIKLDSNKNVSDIELIAGDNDNIQTEFENVHDNSRSVNNRPSGATSIPRDSINNRKRSPFKKSLYEDDPDFAKCLLNNDPENQTYCGDTHRKTTFQPSLYEDMPASDRSLRNTDVQYRKSDNGNIIRKSLLQQNLQENNRDLIEESIRYTEEIPRKSGNDINTRRSSFQQSVSENNPDLKSFSRKFNETVPDSGYTEEISRKSGNDINNRRSSFQQSVSENNPDLKSFSRKFETVPDSGYTEEISRKSGNDINRRSSFQQSVSENNPDLKSFSRIFNETVPDSGYTEEISRKSGNDINNKRSSFQQSMSENNPDLKSFSHKFNETVPDSGYTEEISHKSGNDINKRRSSFQQNVSENNPDSKSFSRKFNETVPNSVSSIRRSTNQSPDGERYSRLIQDKQRAFKNEVFTNLNHSYSGEHSDIETVPHNSDGVFKSEINNHQKNISRTCPCCGSTESFKQNAELFRCPACQHRCVYCKSCFEMHESIYNCLKGAKEGKCDQLIRPRNSNINPPKDDKNFWAEAMLYFTPNFLTSLKKDSKSGNLNMPNQNLMTSTEQKCTQVNQTITVPSEPSSPECDRKSKYKWVLIRVEYFEDGTREINLINDTDIPENSYLTASK